MIEVMLLKRLVNDIGKATKARCAVVVAEDGSVVASMGDTTESRIGEITLLLKVITEEVASYMSLGAVGEILVEGPDYKMLTIGWQGHTIAIMTGKEGATTQLKKEVKALLDETTILEGVNLE